MERTQGLYGPARSAVRPFALHISLFPSAGASARVPESPVGAFRFRQPAHARNMLLACGPARASVMGWKREMSIPRKGRTRPAAGFEGLIGAAADMPRAPRRDGFVGGRSAMPTARESAGRGPGDLPPKAATCASPLYALLCVSPQLPLLDRFCGTAVTPCGQLSASLVGQQVLFKGVPQVPHVPAIPLSGRFQESFCPTPLRGVRRGNSGTGQPFPCSSGTKSLVFVPAARTGFSGARVVFIAHFPYGVVVDR